MRAAVFLDRDDTLIHCRDVAPDGDLGDPAMVRLKPGVAEGCRALKEAGFALVVITNQGGVARGKYGLDAVDRVNARLNELLGGVIDSFRACPYHPKGVVPEFTREHPWRKPQPGMILDAAAELGLDVSRSWTVGDAPRDCEAGKAAGTRTVLIHDAPADEADFTVGTFAEAVRTILANHETTTERPRRVIVIMPTWVGDAVMATPALRALRDNMPGALLCALVKPGIEELLAGSDFFDEIVVDSRAGVMGVKRAAAKVRALRCDTALLLTNSFSTALLARLATVPQRIGYGRDGRSMLLTESLQAPKRVDTAPYCESTTSARTWAPIPACDYYFELVRRALRMPSLTMGPMRLGVSDAQREAGAALLARALPNVERPFAVLNPGGNNPAKRWPADRFAQIARWLESEQGIAVVVSGSPSERELVDEIVRTAELPPERSLVQSGVTLGSLKEVLRQAALLVTNDTGPRHIAAAFGTPVVTLFGPTDPRWTTIPFEKEAIVVADPTLPAHEVAEDHPERCRIDRIDVRTVIDAIETVVPALPARS